MKRDFHQKLLLRSVAFPDYFEFLFWILLPPPHYVKLVELVLHVRNRIQLAVEGILENLIFCDTTELIHSFYFPKEAAALALKTGTLL